MGSPVKKYPARENPNAGRIDQPRRKDMRLFQAEHLFAQIQNIRAVGIERCCRHVAAIVNGVDRGQRIPLRKKVVHSRGSKILANRLQRTAEDLGECR